MQRKFYFTMCILLSALLGQHANAQGFRLQGNVTDDKGESLPGVSIIIKGTSQGTSTDANGNYSLDLPDQNAVLVFSFVGYESREVSVAGRSVVNVTLNADITTLDEVVVIGYGEVRKSDLTGSVASVKGEELNAFPATNVLQAMSGRAAGVQVSQNNGAPGGSISVRIRGTNSIQGSNEPLYVVDGFPLSASNPTVLNNSNIESIEVLKDASATAIYGSRGANGVVLITTKRGKQGKTIVDFETSYSVQKLRKKLDMMNAREYAQFYNLQAANDGLAQRFTEEEIANFGEGFDWQDLIFRTAPMQNHNLTVSGGNDRTMFAVGMSMFGQEGIIKGSDYDRYSLNTNVQHKVSEKFRIDLNTTLTRATSNRQNSGGGNRGNSLINSAVSAYPTLTPYNDDGSYRELATAYPFGSNVIVNPLNFINETTDRIQSNKVLANAALVYNPVPELTVRISGGVENTDDRTDAYRTLNYVNSQGVASVGTSQFTSLLNENTVTYAKTFAERHSITAIAGFTYQNFRSTSLNGSGIGFLSDVTETHDLGSASSPGIPGSGFSEAVLISYLGRVNYTLDNKYLATLSFRTDGSSRYSEGNKWGYFPSGALAWRLSEEDFMKDNGVVSDLKIRAGWGLTGSQAIGAYATLNQLSSDNTIFDDALFVTFAPGTRLPGDLKWETTEQTDFGIDAGFLENRLRITADYYVKTTRDLLNTVALPSSLGFTSTIRNVGSVQNKGVEFSLAADVIDRAFKWDVSANLSINRNKVLKLNDGLDILGGTFSISFINDDANILREGQPIGRFWGYVEEGYDENGKIVYKDLDNDGAISILDKTYIGDPNPDFIYGFNSFMSYKNFELTLFIQGTQGNDLFNISAIGNTLDYNYGLNMPKEVFYNHWTPENPNAKYPVISRTTSARVSDRFVEDGSYLRLRNIQLAYNLTGDFLKSDWIRNIQVYASGQNLLTLTKYSWWDPEVNSRGGSNSTAQGFDYYSYPTAKTITFGVRASF